ncbi:MAG: GCN5-related N-acetyltransferase [Herbaspirillum sp.]|nr:GCN5-related N-acetyltransferase [Herbaspirillum sp.]
MLRIRDAREQDEAVWRNLWAGYTAFYETQVVEEVTARTWARILDPASPIFCTLAEYGDGDDDRIVGFAVCVLHEGTWSTQPVCYLEDLFVAAEHRGAGIGRAIIEDLCQRGAAAGWAQLYWSTHRNNPGRKLYDEFTQADESVRYRLDVKLRPSDARFP